MLGHANKYHTALYDPMGKQAWKRGLRYLAGIKEEYGREFSRLWEFSRLTRVGKVF